MQNLFSAQTADGSEVSGSLGAGLKTVFCWGTFDSATVKVQLSPDGSEWFDLDDLTFTAKGVVNFMTQIGVQYRANLSSAGGSTSVNLGIA
ncbi:MAG: hypothetical protein GY934_03615 [Gammaproteobacteria bacterium]|nr:hypothetical protein [Gammaproteobacteria bacterium]